VPDEEGVRTRSMSNLFANSEQEEDDAECTEEGDGDSEFGIDDSDYAIEEEDDDLYVENVDDDENKVNVKRMKGKAPKIEGDGDSEDDDIWAPESHEECHELRFKTFRPEDLTAPVFRVGLKFEDVALLRRAIKEYACQNRRDIKLPINDLKRLKVLCNGIKSCPWYLWASYHNRPKQWMIQRYTDKHTCSKKWNIGQFTADFVADKFLPSFKADQ
jgi:hypothetical protein